MQQVFTQTLVQMLRIAVLIAIGFGLSRGKILPQSFKAVIGKMITTVFLPMLTLYSFITNCTVERLTANASLLAFGTLAVVIWVGLAYLLAGPMAKRDPYYVGVMRYAISMPNTGAFASSLTLAFLGSEGYFFFSLFTFVQTVVCYSWGILQLMPTGADEKRAGLWKKILNPNFIAMLIGAALGLTGANDWMPVIVLENVQAFGNCYVLMSLLLVGFSVADFSMREMLPDAMTFFFIGFRMLLLPAGMLLLFRALGAPYYACYFAAVCSACPCGMNAVVYPVAYGQDCRRGAALVLFTSLCSVGTIPLIYAFMTRFLP